MELLQDLQKHFQSLVFTINMQYGNMISMNEFFDGCKSNASLLADCLDLFECVGERMIALEKENSKYKQIILQMKTLYTEEVTRLRNDLQEIKQQAILYPNLHMDESLHLFHVWDFTTKSFEHTSRTLLNNSWKANVDLTNKIKLYEKDIGKLKKELLESSNSRSDEVSSLEKNLGKKCKDNEEKVTQLKSELAILEKEHHSLQKSSKVIEQEMLHKLNYALQIKSLDSLSIDSLKHQIESTMENNHVDRVKASEEVCLVQEIMNSTNVLREEFYRLLEESKENTKTLEKSVEHLTKENIDLQSSVKNTLRLYSLLVRASKGFSFDNEKN